MQRERPLSALDKLFADLESGMQIDKYALDEGLQEQPELFYRVSQELAERTSRRDALKQYVDEVKAHTDIAIRRNLRDTEAKITEKEVENLVRVHKEVVAALDSYQRASAIVTSLTALKEAFQQRSYALKELAGLYVAQYYTANEHSATRSAMRQADDGTETRRALREARKAAGR